ncbi:MAG TPA: hypothetical protein PLW48_01490 [Alphaproteobacteria bacterium]|nr:hypothetical protein [Rhodospirillaceae bacterium]HRJ65785.1 hypothetical protein [Alphaproteobacteria bacterium]
MSLFGSIKKILAVVGITAFMAAGYLSLNVATSCKSQAQCVCSLCTYAAGGMGTAINLVNTTTTLPGITIATTMITAKFTEAMIAFDLAVAAKILEVGKNLNDWFDTFWLYNLRPAMQAMTVQLNTADADQSNIIGQYSDSMDANRTNMALMGTEIEEHRAMRPSETVCVGATTAGGMARAANIRRAYATSAPRERLNRSGARQGTAAANGPGADQGERWQDYVANYCDPTVNGGAAGCTAAGPMVGRDLDVTGEIFEKDTIDVRDANTRKVVDDLLTNIVEPITMAPVPTEMLSGAEGQELFLEGEAYKTRRQVLFDAVYYIVARRVPGSDMAEFIEPIRTAAGLTNSSDNPSHNEVMDALMVDRYRSGQNTTNQVDEPENNARELVMQQALQAMQMSDQIDLLDRYALIIAARVGKSVNEHSKIEDKINDKPVNQ